METTHDGMDSKAPSKAHEELAMEAILSMIVGLFIVKQTQELLDKDPERAKEYAGG